MKQEQNIPHKSLAYSKTTELVVKVHMLAGLLAHCNYMSVCFCSKDLNFLFVSLSVHMN